MSFIVHRVVVPKWYCTKIVHPYIELVMCRVAILLCADLVYNIIYIYLTGRWFQVLHF